MPENPGLDALRQMFGAIRGAAGRHETTAQVWEAARDAYRSITGRELSGPGISAMNEMRRIAGQQVRAFESFQRARPDEQIGAHMIGPELDQRAANIRAASPQYLVRFEHQYLSGDEVVSEWRTNMWSGQLPPTKEMLLEQIDLDAQMAAEDYNVSHLGVGDVEITEA